MKTWVDATLKLHCVLNTAATCATNSKEKLVFTGAKLHAAINIIVCPPSATLFNGHISNVVVHNLHQMLQNMHAMLRYMFNLKCPSKLILMAVHCG